MSVNGIAAAGIVVTALQQHKGTTTGRAALGLSIAGTAMKVVQQNGVAAVLLGGSGNAILLENQLLLPLSTGAPVTTATATTTGAPTITTAAVGGTPVIVVIAE